MLKKPKFIGLSLVGPTASGKSELAVRLAKKLNGEILSVDSRQVYKGMDIGSGKVTPLKKLDQAIYSYKGVPHYGLNLINPKNQFTVAEFKNYADKAISQIEAKHKLPILCGGTMHWMDAVIYNQPLPVVPPNPSLRKKLERETTESLNTKLSVLDPKRYSTIDKHNRRRLIRALEIVIETGKPVPTINTKPTSNYLWIGLNPDQSELRNKITKRLRERLKEGLLEEIESLHKKGLSWKKLEGFGLEYKQGSLLLQKTITKEVFINDLTFDIFHYAKRQMTWWKKNKEIHWFRTPQEAINFIDRTHPHWHHNQDEISH